MSDERYIEENKKWWDSIVESHEQSDFYDNKSFKEGGISLNQIELPYLQDLKGKDVLHIQCHFGQDTISFARLGAKSVVGTDISPKAIKIGTDMAKELGIDNVKFVESNTLHLNKILNSKFDIVFMSYGVVTWLPSISQLADIIKSKLRPGGIVLLADFHPALYMHDFDTHEIGFPYFNIGAVLDVEEGSYAGDSKAESRTYFWSHSISELLMGFIQNDFNIEVFNEYDYSPYNCFPNMVEVKSKEYVFGDVQNRLPHIYLVKARYSPT